VTKKLEYENLWRDINSTVVPSQTLVPDWYKKTPRYSNKKVTIVPDTRTFKACIPFLDSFTVGYQVVLPIDILITKELNALGALDSRITWHAGGVTPLSFREPSQNAAFLPIPKEYSQKEYVWLLPASIRVPAGYSCMFTHPINRFDLPFTTLSGIIDGGFAVQAGGSLPFFLRDDFEGVIPQGTPIAQLIPFKTENWKSVDTPGLVEEAEKNVRKLKTQITGWYKQNIWTRKTYS